MSTTQQQDRYEMPQPIPDTLENIGSRSFGLDPGSRASQSS